MGRDGEVRGRRWKERGVVEADSIKWRSLAAEIC